MDSCVKMPGGECYEKLFQLATSFIEKHIYTPYCSINNHQQNVSDETINADRKYMTFECVYGQQNVNTVNSSFNICYYGSGIYLGGDYGNYGNYGNNPETHNNIIQYSTFIFNRDYNGWCVM